MMLSEARQRELVKGCQHSVHDMLLRERQFIPLFKKGDGLVWCEDCGVWIPFERGPSITDPVCFPPPTGSPQK